MSKWDGIAPDAAGIRTSPAKAYRHSSRVRRLRLIVPAAAAGIIATYVLSATPPQIDRAFLEQFAEVDAESKTLRLSRPRHLGYDLEGNAFEVAALAAERRTDVPRLIDLENPQAFRGIDRDEDVAARALRGQMDTEANRLNLADDVQLDHRIGGQAFTLMTDAAEVDFEGQTVSTSTAVTGQGDRGTLAADSMTSYQEDGRVVLEGNVRLRFLPASGNGEAELDAEIADADTDTDVDALR